MLNSGKLAGKTIFITGASRGIGKAIALKAAKDGANIAIAAKTTEPHDKLPGTIYTAAEEIEKAGGRCLPCKVDIREEAEVQKAVEECVKKFGCIDILVNNASAISLTGTLETPMKKYDLMNQINARGTFLVSQKCIPYLKSSKNAHILNLSPPLNMRPIWFSNHLAYTMAKYGMSMCALGMSAELKRFNIAVNALWPKTAIWTSAMKLIGSEGVRKKCRKPDIMADAAYVILTRDSRSYTGQFYVDEEVLKEVGVTDFNQYAESPESRGELLLDFFLPEAEARIASQLERSAASPSAQQPSKAHNPTLDKNSKTSTGDVAEMFSKLQPLITVDLVEDIKALYKFQLTGAEPGIWYIDLKSERPACGPGDPPNAANPDVVFNCDSEKLVAMFSGSLKPTMAFMTGQLKIQGNLSSAMKLERLMGQVKSKL